MTAGVRDLPFVPDVEQLATDVRDIVEAVHGRGRPHTVVVLSQVVCTDDRPCWIAKVKRGRAIVAKCGTPPCGHVSAEGALEELAAATRRALGVLR